MDAAARVGELRGVVAGCWRAPAPAVPHRRRPSAGRRAGRRDSVTACVDASAGSASTACATTAATSSDLAAQADQPAGDARHVHEIVDRAGTRCSTCRWITAADLPRCAARHVRQADRAARPSRIAASGLRSSCASTARNSSFRRLASSQLGRALGDPQLELAIQPLELPRLAVQLDEDADLGAQDLRHDRHRDVVHGAVLVALQPVELGERDAGDEDDRRLAGSAGARASSPPARTRRAPACMTSISTTANSVRSRCSSASRAESGRHQRRVEPSRIARRSAACRLVVDQQDVDVVAPAVEAHGRRL